MPKNPCKHPKPVVLTTGTFVPQWLWCPDCGATRLQPSQAEIAYHGGDNIKAEQEYGRLCNWRSPRSMTRRQTTGLEVALDQARAARSRAYEALREIADHVDRESREPGAHLTWVNVNSVLLKAMAAGDYGEWAKEFKR